MATHDAKKAARFEFEFALLMMMAGRDRETEKSLYRLNDILNALPEGIMIELPDGMTELPDGMTDGH